MCILFVSLNQHPNYPLVVVANRDEFHQRATDAMSWWQTPKILAGKDLVAGGTWLGLTENGRFAALTNYRQFPLKNDQAVASRGELVVKALTATNNAQFLAQLQNDDQKYQGFNLLYGDAQGLVCIDNINQKVHQRSQGIFSLCNGALDDIWPKMAKGEQALEHYIANHEQLNHQELLTLLHDQQQAPQYLLPATGLSLDWEQKLSAIFIKGPEYGTRSSCIITLDNNQNMKVTEVCYCANGNVEQQANFQWQLTS
ncbi:NRDE family protein [Colwellia sp. MEBiC06753]